jgi:uncharacterized membrane protein (DUF2068 family)
MVAKKAPLGLKLVAAEKIIKGVVLACLSLGIFDSIHRDLGDLARHFVKIARISPENRFVVLALEKLGLVEPGTLVRLGILSAFYASILLIEGLGLWFGAAWAEYFVVISSGIFVPEECLVTIRHFTWFHFSILVINTVVLVYMAVLVWNRYKARRREKEEAKEPALPAPAP